MKTKSFLKKISYLHNEEKRTVSGPSCCRRAGSSARTVFPPGRTGSCPGNAYTYTASVNFQRVPRKTRRRTLWCWRLHSCTQRSVGASRRTAAAKTRTPRVVCAKLGRVHRAAFAMALGRRLCLFKKLGTPQKKYARERWLGVRLRAARSSVQQSW